MIARVFRAGTYTAKNLLAQYKDSVCKTKILYLAAVLALLPSSVHAACHAVTPSGSGSKSGADWNNAYAGIPGTLTRGDTYYFADGSYGSYTFSQAASGTSVIHFKKAQSYDFGRSSDGCSNDISTGWNTSTMGSGQAKFSGNGTIFLVNATFFDMNGNGTSTGPGCGGGGSSGNVSALPPTPTDCGFILDNTGDTATTALAFVPDPANSTFEYVEVREAGDNANDQFDIKGYGSNTTYTHLYMHNSGCVFMQSLGSNTTVNLSYFWGTETNGSNGSCHGQAEFAEGGQNNNVRSNNVYRDVIGTAIWTVAGPGSGTASNWVFYNNVIWYSSPLASWVSGAGSAAPSDGIVACINSGVSCSGFQLYQNSIVNVPSFGVPGINSENAGTYTVENNLWYQDSFGINLPSSGMTQDHNSFLNSTTSCPSGTANVCNNSSANPFTNWQGGNFTLASDGASWNNRISLGSPYNIDLVGDAFTTDRGTYQYVSESGGPQPPTNLLATVQ
ncbi:MAG TPA: hypothetical protein VMG82_28020 [Candidatus Sulfotelmatobacter sp.]|nr:hypothetical protein [Candidatus Sulfotelmatobacter sp.]